MSGIFTDKRDLSRPVLVRYWSGGTSVPGDQLKTPDYQETTSYRSGRELSDEESLKQDSVVLGDPRFITSAADTGHEFQSIRRRFISTTVSDFSFTYKGAVEQRGPLLISGQQSNNLDHWLPSVQPMTVNERVAFGQRAIIGSAPTRPDAGLLTAVGELARDGVPAIIGSLAIRTKRASSLGDEYLNVVFGWKPLVADLLKLMRSVVKSSRTIAQLQKDSGRVVRRRFSFPASTRIESDTYQLDQMQNAICGYPPNLARFVEPITSTRLITESVWFSGALSYYTDPGVNLVGKAKKYEALANKVLGTRLTPSVLYQLAPWSWLVDWFVDVGSATEAASLLADDNLVIRWGYLMRRTDVFRTLRTKVAFPVCDGAPTIDVANFYRTVRKERWRASPYGFAVNTDPFSDQRLAILAALALSRSPKIGR